MRIRKPMTARERTELVRLLRLAGEEMLPYGETCDWDDSGGSQAVANAIIAIIGDAWRPSHDA